VILLLVAPMVLLGWSPDGDARRRRPPPRREASKVNQQAAKAIPALVGKYKWNLNKDQVVRLLTANLMKAYIERIRKARNDPMRQDRLRAEEAAEIAKVRKSFTEFDGKRTNWDSSIIDDQFGHSNSESMVVYLEKEQQRFFFFYNGKLYKQFIAFNADHPNYKGLTFPQFLGKLIQAFGQGTPVFLKDVAGQSRLHHVEWIGANNVHMWAVDKSTLYGNFCVVLFDSTTKAKVDEGRKTSGAGPRRAGDDDLIDSVTKPKPEHEK
jgi:hypothetical protein